MRGRDRVMLAVALVVSCGAPRSLEAADAPFGPSKQGLTAGVRAIEAGEVKFELTYVDADPAKFLLRILAARPLVAEHSQLQSGTYTTSGLPLTDFQALSSATAIVSGGYLGSFAPVEALGYV